MGAALQADGENEVRGYGLKHQKEKRSMDHFAGLDVSVKETSVCIVDDTGKIVRAAASLRRRAGRRQSCFGRRGSYAPLGAIVKSPSCWPTKSFTFELRRSPIRERDANYVVHYSKTSPPMTEMGHQHRFE